jgi:hypothetical protein
MTEIIVGARLQAAQKVKVKCPYCGNEFELLVNFGAGMAIAYCDVDETPGCGKAFAYLTPYVVPVTIQSFCIENEAQP